MKRFNILKIYVGKKRKTNMEAAIIYIIHGALLFVPVQKKKIEKIEKKKRWKILF